MRTGSLGERPSDTLGKTCAPGCRTIPDREKTGDPNQEILIQGRRLGRIVFEQAT